MQTTSIESLDQLLNGQAGVPGLRTLLASLLGRRDAAERVAYVEKLESHHGRVYRLNFIIGGCSTRSLIIKRLDPCIGFRNELVAQRWLPAVGLSESAPELLGVTAEQNGRSVWHVYEDLGDAPLNPRGFDAVRVGIGVELIAQLHTRFANHVLLPECRLWGGDFGINFFSSNVRDAIRCLESLDSDRVDLSSADMTIRDRLLGRLQALLDEQPRRAEAFAEFGGPETLLHGDLWTTNIFVTPTSTGLRARLIDWDHAAVGPTSYDLSTFLLRFPAEHRLQILEIYREEVARAGWTMPQEDVLNVLFETAEFARFANRIIWPAIALVKDNAKWAFAELAEVEQWFEQWRPVLSAKEQTLSAIA